MPYIIHYVYQKNFTPLKNWDSRNSSSKFYTIKKIRHILNLLSGNNLSSMLSDVLNKSEKQALNDRFVNVVKKVAEISNHSKPKSRYKYINAMRNSKFSLKETRALKFNCGKFLWKTSGTNIERNKGKI